MRPGMDFEDMRDWAGKAPGVAARVAGVFHVAKYVDDEQWRLEIDRDTIERACEIVAVSARHAALAFGLMDGSDGSDPARKALAWIGRNGTDRFTARDAWRALRGSRTAFPNAATVHDPLAEPRDRGYVRIIMPPVDGPGRPASPLIIVGPEGLS